MATISPEIVSLGERRDLSGRRLATTAKREAILAAYDESGLSQREFAKRDGVKYHTLVTWLVRRRRETEGKERSRTTFTEVTLPRGTPSTLEISLPNGLVVRGTEVEQLCALVQALSR